MDQKQNYGMERFNNKAYTSAAKALTRNPVDPKLKPLQVKPVVFYGNAGQGHGSRIKGYRRRSTIKLQRYLKEKTTESWSVSTLIALEEKMDLLRGAGSKCTNKHFEERSLQNGDKYRLPRLHLQHQQQH
ncbi:hypothetical protein BC941DRAFT_473694 [Chlamydoabsidia padenii]|nr:hypothetical protein BC941DRAFT_473694 [Chlamydoabsidia padenii]